MVPIDANKIKVMCNLCHGVFWSWMLYLDHACKEVTKIYMLLFYFSGTKLPAGNNKTNSKISSVLFTIGRVLINALVFSDFFLFRNLPVTFYFINKRMKSKEWSNSMHNQCWWSNVWVLSSKIKPLPPEHQLSGF